MICLYNNLLKNSYFTFENQFCYLGGEGERPDKTVSNQDLAEFRSKQKALDEKIKNSEMEIEAKRRSVVNTAANQTRKIIDRVQNECQSIMEQKLEEGFNEGMKVARARCEELDREIENVKNSIIKECDKQNKLLEDNILEIAFALSKKIMDIQLERDDTAILSALGDVVNRFKEDKNLSIDVSESVAEKLNSEEIKTLYKINANKELSKEEILLNSNYGTVDASIPVQFNNLRRSVLEEYKRV